MSADLGIHSEGGEERGGIRYRWRAPTAPGAVDGLHSASFAEAPGLYGWDRIRPCSLGWVTATRGRELVGFVNVAWDGHRHAFLVDTAVAPDHRRQGIGRRMLGRAVEEARRAGCQFVHVDFEPHLTTFYWSSGFTETAAGLIALG